jgi:hypothetical protein
VYFSEEFGPITHGEGDVEQESWEEGCLKLRTNFLSLRVKAEDDGALQILRSIYRVGRKHPVKAMRGARRVCGRDGDG